MSSTPLPEITEALDYSGPKHLDDVGYAAESAADRNRLRAYWAAMALKAYGDEVGYDVVETLLSDLIADLRHFAVACKGEDDDPIGEDEFDSLQDSAKSRWIEEAFLGE